MTETGTDLSGGADGPEGQKPPPKSKTGQASASRFAVETLHQRIASGGTALVGLVLMVFGVCLGWHAPETVSATYTKTQLAYLVLHAGAPLFVGVYLMRVAATTLVGAKTPKDEATGTVSELATALETVIKSVKELYPGK